ncbi:MAG: C-GCAxxG-C-C family protein [bacterium]|nr:C-GCAxxG-C-C family protein [bacterium]
MSKYLKKAEELRAITNPHYNCAQAVLIPFAHEMGLTEDAANKVAANFGGGMKMAATCGSIAGGLMVLGLFGLDDPKTIGEYYRRLKESHAGHLNCSDLLRINKEAGGEKKPHCDSMVYECVTLVEELLREQGKLK